ncbi:MAG: hypothetical protein QOH92_3061 [Chloroflexota bacterium]|nr:hypothetical protein [Chloroflexota bacterium]
MFALPGASSELGQKLSRRAAERIASNWSMLLLNGLLLIVAGVLIFSIDWTVRSLATFIGALFIFQGLMEVLTSGIGDRVRGANLLTGLLSVAAGVVILAWPAPGHVAVAVFLGAWLIVMGTLTISSSLAVRDLMPDWWLALIMGLLEVPLGVLALADPGATLAALITVSGIWAVAIGVVRVVFSFELKRLPYKLEGGAAHTNNGAQVADGEPASATSA